MENRIKEIETNGKPEAGPNPLDQRERELLQQLLQTTREYHELQKRIHQIRTTMDQLEGAIAFARGLRTESDPSKNTA